MLSSFEQRWENLHHRLLRLAGKTELDRLCLEKKGRKTKIKKQRKTRQTDYLQRVVHRALSSQYLKLWERLSQQVDIWNAPSTGMLARYFYSPTHQDQPWHSWEWACPENQPARYDVAAWCHPQPYVGQVATPASVSLVGDLAPKGWCLWKLRFRSTKDKDEDMLSNIHSGIHRWLFSLTSGGVCGALLSFSKMRLWTWGLILLNFPYLPLQERTLLWKLMKNV